MRRVWPWLVLAACSSQGSIELVVTAPGLPVTNVELFVGVHDEHLEKIRPQHGPLAQAVWWKRDRSQTTDLAPLVDGQVRYQLVNGGSLGDSLAAFVVVGYDETDKPIAVRSHMIWTDISDNMIDRYEFVLGAAQEPPGSTDTPGVQVWGPPRSATSAGDPHACVQVDSVPELAEYGDGTVPKSGMIVTAGDPDCDGLVDPMAPDFECATNEYMGRGAINRSGLQCLIATTFVEPDVTTAGCVVGGGACIDGTPTDGSGCAPTTYCMPSAACVGCPETGCDPYSPSQNTPYLKCYVFAASDAGGGAGEFCPNASRLDLATLLPGLNLQCDPDRPAMLRKDRSTSWLTEMYPIVNNAIPSSSAFLEVKAAGGNCQYDFAASGPRPTTSDNTGLTEFEGTLSIPIGASDDGRGMMIPIYFQVGPYTNECTTQSAPACSLVGSLAIDDAGFGACLSAPIAPGTQVRD